MQCRGRGGGSNYVIMHMCCLIQIFKKCLDLDFNVKNYLLFWAYQGTKIFSILYLSCRTSGLQFSLVLQTYVLVLYKLMQ